MTREIKIIDPLHFPQWDTYLLEHEEATFFHSAAWASTLYDTYRYKPLYFADFDDHKLTVLVPVMEINSILTGRRGASLPFTDMCKPIISNNNNLKDVMESILHYGKKSKWKCFVLRGGTHHLEAITPTRSFYTHTLDLSKDEQHMFTRFQSTTQRNIRKAMRAGVEIEICNSMEAVRKFYRLYSITRKRVGTAIESFTFFRNLYKHVISQEQGIVALASHMNKPVAAAIYVHFGKNVMFLFGGSDKRHQHLRPNNLLMWEIIKWYAKNGFESFSFGITDFENSGLRRYKAGMATKEEMLGYYVYDFHNDDFLERNTSIATLKRNFYKKLPVPLLKILGALFYKHINSYYR